MASTIPAKKYPLILGVSKMEAAINIIQRTNSGSKLSLNTTLPKVDMNLSPSMVKVDDAPRGNSLRIVTRYIIRQIRNISWRELSPVGCDEIKAYCRDVMASLRVVG